jgi:hypothetical protein
MITPGFSYARSAVVALAIVSACGGTFKVSKTGTAGALM